METRLGSIKDFVQRFADIISNTVDADVIIVDNNMEIVGAAFRYFSLYNTIEEGSIISEVITEKKKVIVEDKGRLEKCLNCRQFHECKMVGFVGVPIFFDTYVVGAIALTLPQHRVKSLFRTIDTSVEFLENMAELIAGKVRNQDENQALARYAAEMEALMDLYTECVVYTDGFGNIRHTNKAFRRSFAVRGSLKGKKLQEVIPHRIFKEYFVDFVELKGERVCYEEENAAFYGIVTSRRVRIKGQEFGIMFLLRASGDIVQDANLSQNGSMVTLKWASYMLPGELVTAARAMAVSPCHILLEGKSAGLNEMVAKGMVNDSERRLKGLKVVYCDNLYRDLLESFLFDEFGELKLADQGTVLIHNIERLPLYLQERLLCFLKTGRLSPSHTSAGLEVRFLFSTTEDLLGMVEKGYFLGELRLRIMEHRLLVPGIQDNQSVFRNVVESGIEFYKKKYHKRGVGLSEDACGFLWEYQWNENFFLLESKLEAIVRRNDGLVTEEMLLGMGTFSHPHCPDLSLSGLEKERICELLEMGHTKTEVARLLGIGRATLYRKMGEYGMR